MERTARAVLLACMAATAVAQEPVVSVGLNRVDQPPLVDGRLTDACWQACEPVGYRRFPHGEKPTYGTEARIATDGKWVFVGYVCEDPTPLVEGEVRHRADTPVTASDCVELFIDPGTDGKVYFHFAADRFGQQHEKKCTFNEWTRSYRRDGDFNAHWRAAGALTDKGWSVEMAIPLHYVAEVAGEAQWRVNFCRHEQDRARNTRAWSAWSLTKKSFHDPERFGVLTGAPEGHPPPMFLPVLEAVRIGIISDARGLNEYPVLVGLRNDCRKGGKVTLVIDDNAPGGGRRQVTETIDLGANDVLVHEVLMQASGMVGEVEPDPVAIVRYQDALGAWTTSMANMMGDFSGNEESHLDVYLDRSYYTTEKEAGLYYAVDLPERQLATLTLTITLAEQELVIETLKPSENRYVVPLTELPHGAHTVTVGLLSDKGKTVEECMLQLVKREPLARGCEVKVDRLDRCLLVNGEPFFPYGVCRLNGGVKTLAEMGFNMFIRWGGYYDTRQLGTAGVEPRDIIENDPVLQDCLKHKVMVIDRPIMSYCGLGQYHTMRRLKSVTKGKPAGDVVSRWFGNWRALIPAAKTHPAIMGYMIFDEPQDDFIGDVPRSKLSQDIASAFRELDGYRPLFNNANLPTEKRWRDHVDLVSTFHYWHAMHPAMGRAISGRAQREGSHAELWHMPYLSMPSSGENMNVPLVHAERRVSVYLRLIAGARGIYYFTWPVNHVASRESLRKVGEEIQVMAPALLRRRPAQNIVTPGVAAPDRAVDAAVLRYPGGRVLFIEANKTGQAIDVQCTFPWLHKEAVFRELFMAEHAHGLVNGGFTEQLEPLGVRAYVVDNFVLPEQAEAPLDIIIRETSPEGQAGTRVVAEFGCERDDEWRIADARRGSVQFDDDVARSGRRSIRLTRREGEPDYLRAHSIPFELKAGHRYRLEAHVRCLFDHVPDDQRHRGAVVEVRMPPGEDHPYICGSIKDTTRDWAEIARQRRFLVRKDATAHIRLQLWRVYGTAWFDDIRIIDLGSQHIQTRKTRNLIPNSSFEIARLKGWPDRWRMPYGDFGDDLMGTPTCPWGQDTQQAVHGKCSLRMAADRGWTTFSWYQRTNAGIRLKDGSHYVLSAHIKANRDDVPFVLWLRDIGEKTVKLTTDWQRYELTGLFREKALNNSTTAVRFSFPRHRPQDAVVWIDAVHLEEGEAPSDYVPDAYEPVGGQHESQ